MSTVIKLIVSVGLLVTRGAVVDFAGFDLSVNKYCSSVVVVPVEYVVEYVVDVVVSFKWFSMKTFHKIFGKNQYSDLVKNPISCCSRSGCTISRTNCGGILISS